MSTQNPWDGSVYVTPDHAVGYGTAISNPGTLLSGMVTNQYYYQEASGPDVDVVFISAESLLISCFKTFQNQKLMQSFVARATNIGGQNKLRWIHRSLATCFTTEQAMRACGVDVTVSDNYSSSNLASINQTLAPHYIQIWMAP